MKLGRTLCAGTAPAAVAVLLAISLPQAHGDILIFGDGFAIEGRVKEATKPIFDEATGASLSIKDPSKPFWLDDGVRKILFSPFQVKAPVADKTKKPDQVIFKRTPPQTNALNPQPLVMLVQGVTEWDSAWQRELTMATPSGTVRVKQRITLLTPDVIKIEATTHKWSAYYHTREFSSEILRSLIYQKLGKENEKEIDIRVQAYRFLLQAGFTEEADKELRDLLRDFPAEKSNVAGMQENIKRVYGLQLVESLHRADKAGLHQEVERKLQQYTKRKLDDILDEKTQLQVQAIKDKYKATMEKLQEARRQILAFADLVPPTSAAFFKEAATVISKELNIDTVERLETFVSLAADYERAVKDKRQPDQTATELMAFALTGWLRGSDAAERDVAKAVQQWEGRQLLLKYLKADDPIVRRSKLAPALKAKIGVDEAMQIIQLMPPADAHQTVDTKPQMLKTQNDGKAFTYHVQLPPGYNHGRTWPVLITMHSSMEKCEEALARWSTLAAENGFIVVAPQWSTAQPAVHQFSAQEHQAVLEALRDVRRRFQVDSDRVFLFGAEQGGNLAFDVGLSHPDQFAGVIPMSATPKMFTRRYWPNAQYLNLYVVNGEESGIASLDTKAMFKETIRCNYPAIYAEYKGRPPEWFTAEQPILFDWMNRKRRTHPLKALGKPEEEFKTHRTTDNQFYWIGISAVHPNNLNSAVGWNSAISPAKLRASVSPAKNGISVSATGIGHITIWFVPKLVNYGEKVLVQINGSAAKAFQVTPNLETLMETLYETGDRQRPCLARLDF